MDNEKELTLDLDALYSEGYMTSEYDIGGSGHSITIKQKNAQAFLDEYSKKFRNLLEEYLEVVEDEEDD